MAVGDKANIQKLIILLYICNKVKIKDVIYNTILKNQCLWINLKDLNKRCIRLCTENYETIRRKIKD